MLAEISFSGSPVLINGVDVVRSLTVLGVVTMIMAGVLALVLVLVVVLADRVEKLERKAK